MCANCGTPFENMVALAAGDKLTVEDLPAEIHRKPEDLANARWANWRASAWKRLKELIATRSRWSMATASRRPTIGIGERTLYRKIKEYGLNE
jgi:transcriptional regulator of acetoin/glycerol metabolism